MVFKYPEVPPRLSTALNNTNIDMTDFSIGLSSAMTGNVYLCNICNSDNRGGAICTSVTQIASQGPIPNNEIMPILIPSTPLPNLYIISPD